MTLGCAVRGARCTGGRVWSHGARRTAHLLVLVAVSACTRDQWQRFPSPDDVVAKVPWFSTMHRGLAIQPYAIPSRPPVSGTVPITGAAPEWHIDNDAELAQLNRMRN